VNDWGAFYLIKKYFPDLKVFSGKQFQFHNSAALTFAKKTGFSGAQLMKELTDEEHEALAQKSEVPLMVHVHGELDYSIPGTELFNSYLSGVSTNRGYSDILQRELFGAGRQNVRPFNLKDYEMIHMLPRIRALEIPYILIDAKRKPKEYVSRVTRAYYLMLHRRENKPTALQHLAEDLGREKTSYFFGDEKNHALTEEPVSGIFLGKVSRIADDYFSFTSCQPLVKGQVLTIHSPITQQNHQITLSSFDINRRNFVKIPLPDFDLEKSDRVYLSAWTEEPKISKKHTEGMAQPPEMSQKLTSDTSQFLHKTTSRKRRQIFVRIDQLDWLRKIYIRSVDKVILNLSVRQMNDFKTGAPFMQANKKKLIFELPLFISENELDEHKIMIQRLHKDGFSHFMINHIAQKELIPSGAYISAGEYITCMNDAAITLMQEQGMTYWMYSRETDKENLMNGLDRDGIVPVFFHPTLLYSRTPSALHHSNQEIFTDFNDNIYHTEERRGIYMVFPDKPVSWLDQIEQLKEAGFHNFLMDFTHMKPSQNKFNAVLKGLLNGEYEEASTAFNFKRQLL
jgi:putative protease